MRDVGTAKTNKMSKYFLKKTFNSYSQFSVFKVFKIAFGKISFCQNASLQNLYMFIMLKCL